MVIAIVNGSTRKNGATGKILRMMNGILEKKADVTIQYYDLVDYGIEYCSGCRVCYRTGKCSITSDNIEEASSQIKNADGIIMGSSTFESYVTGRLKSFWDRGHFVLEQGLFDKYCFGVVTYEIAEGSVALNALRKFFLVSGGIRAGSILKKVLYNEDPGNDDRFFLQLTKKTEAFYQSIQKGKKRTLFEYLFTKVILIPLIWKPEFQIRKDDYKGVLEAWNSKHII